MRAQRPPDTEKSARCGDGGTPILAALGSRQTSKGGGSTPFLNTPTSLYGQMSRVAARLVSSEEVHQMEDTESTSQRGVFWTWIGVIAFGLAVMIVLPLAGR